MRKRNRRKKKFNPETSHPNGYRAISHRSGMDIGHISRILNGHRDPLLSTVQTLAKGMGLTLDELVALIQKKRKCGVPQEVSQRIIEGMKRAKSVAA